MGNIRRIVAGLPAGRRISLPGNWIIRGFTPACRIRCDTLIPFLPEFVHPFLAANDITIDDINHLIFHPGGKKIVQIVEDLFGSSGKNIDDTKEVLKLYGNMSSATVLYVLERFLDKDIPKGELGLMLSFGPGFSAQRVLLEF